MSEDIKLKSRPKGLLRWFLRMPIWLYRLNMGWMMGSRFVLLKHTGRKSGSIRYAVIEVVHHDKTSNVTTVASGWGTQSDWYRNIYANPDVRLVTNKGEFAATAVILPIDAGVRMLEDYARRNPAAFRALAKFLLDPGMEIESIDMEKAVEMMPVISFIPKS